MRWRCETCDVWKSCRTGVVMAILWGGIAFGAWSRPPDFKYEELMHSPAKIIRPCCTFGADLSVARIPFLRRSDIIATDRLGEHRFLGGDSEGNGIIYTGRGGFVDIAHLRDVADWTGYLYHLVDASEGADRPVKWTLGLEGADKELFLQVPTGLQVSEKAALAGRIAYELSVWHEIATWFTGSILPFIPERYSSFSPEDMYSNMLGVHIGILAIESDLEFDVAMTTLIGEVLKELDAVPTAEATYEAMCEVEGIWWTNERPLPDGSVLLARYAEAGDTLHPWRLPFDKHASADHPLVKPGTTLASGYELLFRPHRLFLLSASECLDNERPVNSRDFPSILRCISSMEGFTGPTPYRGSGIGK